MTAAVPRAETSAPLLRVEGLTVEFATQDGRDTVVEGVSFRVDAGETLGLVGESGCGKTVSSLAVMGLLPPRQSRVVAGSVQFNGRELTALDAEQMRRIRGSEIAMIFQEPMTSLNPAYTVGNQIAEVVRTHRGGSRRDSMARAVEMLDLVGIPNALDRVRSYPHEFSGGMRQRAMIAMALACDPKLLIADEPTTALDVTIQAQILELIELLKHEFAMAVIFVTHDLGVVAQVCDRVVVMYAGQVVEEETIDELFLRPRHPYTAGLLAAMPQNAVKGQELRVITGTVPRPNEMPLGCRFAARCEYREDRCSAAPVEFSRIDFGGVRCIRHGELDLEGTPWKP